MTLEFAALTYNSNLIGIYGQMEAAAHHFGELAVLTNDPDVVTDTINESLMLMQDLLEATVIMDPDIDIQLCPDCQAEENNADKESETIPILTAQIEVNPDDKLLRATMGVKEGQLDYITDWVDYNPDPDESNDEAIAQAFLLLSETISRRYRLSQLKEEPKSEN